MPETPALVVGRHVLVIHRDHPDDRAAIEAALRSLPAEADLSEPFGRVRDALAETSRLPAVA